MSYKEFNNELIQFLEFLKQETKDNDIAKALKICNLIVRNCPTELIDKLALHYYQLLDNSDFQNYKDNMDTFNEDNDFGYKLLTEINWEEQNNKYKGNQNTLQKVFKFIDYWHKLDNDSKEIIVYHMQELFNIMDDYILQMSN